MYPRISSNLLFPCLGLLSPVITSMCHQTICPVLLHLTIKETQQDLMGKEYQSLPSRAGMSSHKRPWLLLGYLSAQPFSFQFPEAALLCASQAKGWYNALTF